MPTLLTADVLKDLPEGECVQSKRVARINGLSGYQLHQSSSLLHLL